MTDKKEIIVDGVDVSGCDRYIKHSGYIGVYNTPVEEGQCKIPPISKCEGSNCLYKQLKRKEQECQQKERDINHLKKCVHDSFKIQEDSERCWKNECNKLIQKLDEIEEMVRNYDDWDLLKDILNIINNAREYDDNKQ